MKIPKSIYEAMIEHARREAPLECCGILAGKNGLVEKIFETRNQEQSPIRYSISPQDQIKVFENLEKESLEMIGVYHSHTHTEAYPSETDLKMAFYPEIASIIISLKDKIPVVKAFRVNKEKIDSEEIEVI